MVPVALWILYVTPKWLPYRVYEFIAAFPLTSVYILQSFNKKEIHNLRLLNNQTVSHSPSVAFPEFNTKYSSEQPSRPQQAPPLAYESRPWRSTTATGGRSQAFRLPGLHGSSRGPCSSHLCKAQASRCPLSELASRLPPQLPLADVDVREPWVALLELLLFGGGLLRSWGFWFVRAGSSACGAC